MIGEILLSLVLLVPFNRVQQVERGLGQWRDRGHVITVVPQWRTPCAPRSMGIPICGKVHPNPIVVGSYHYGGWIEIHPGAWGNSRVICHEVGHALGYPHSTDRRDCMWSPVARRRHRNA